MWEALRSAAGWQKRDLVVVITDEQTADFGAAAEVNAAVLAVINVAANQRGVGYGPGILLK